MAVGETARLIASLELKDLFTKTIGNAEKSLGHFDSRLDRTQGRAYRAGQQIGTGIRRGAVLAAGGIGFLVANLALGVKSLEDLEQVTTQTNAVLKSTKGVAGESAAAIRDLAQKYEDLNATIDDKVIQSAENVLLTFTGIRKNAFEPALLATLNLSTAMGTDLQQAAVQVGKALNDPAKGLGALTRNGVVFTDQQKKTIKSLVESGKTFEAQKIIIAELNREFGNSFVAQGQTTGAKFKKVQDAVEQLQQALAKALLPTLGRLADVASNFLGRADVQKRIEDLGQAIADLFSPGNIQQGAKLLQTAFETFQTAAPILEDAAKASLGFIKAGVDIFNTLPDPIKALAIGGFALNKITGGLVTNIGGALLDLIGKSRGASPANPVFVADVSGGLGGAAGGGIAGTLRGLIAKLGGLALVGGGIAATNAGVSMGGPAGAGVAAGGAAATIAGGALIAGPLGAIAGSLVAVGQTLIQIRDQSAGQGEGIAASIKQEIAGGANLSDLRKSLDAVDQGINDIQANPLNVLVAGDALDQLRSQHDLLTQQIAVQSQIATQGVQANAILDRGGKATVASVDAFRSGAAFIARNLLARNRELAAAIKSIGASRDQKAIQTALNEINATLVKAGKGNADTARAAAAGIRRALKVTHDPTLQAALKKALADVEGKIPGREYARAQLKKADDIVRSNRPIDQKLRDLKAIEANLDKHTLPGAQKAIREKIGALQTAATTAAGKTTTAIKNKDLSVTTNVTATSPDVFIGPTKVASAIARYIHYGGKTAV